MNAILEACKTDPLSAKKLWEKRECVYMYFVQLGQKYEHDDGHFMMATDFDDFDQAVEYMQSKIDGVFKYFAVYR